MWGVGSCGRCECRSCGRFTHARWEGAGIDEGVVWEDEVTVLVREMHEREDCEGHVIFEVLKRILGWSGQLSRGSSVVLVTA